MRFFFYSVFVLFCSRLAAQDTHYWTQQYGTRSSLMGGAVIGGVKDNSSVFYNPACLANNDTSSVSINADLYQVDKTRIKNALGNQQDFLNSNFSNLPLLISGMIPTGNHRLKIGYGFASSADYTFKAVARIDGNYQIVDDSESPGTEAYIAQLSLDSKITEAAFGAGLGQKINDHWSIGMTTLFTWRYQSYDRVLFTRMFLNTPGNPLVSANHAENFSYNNLRAQLKLGLHYKGKRVDAGLSLNTPSLKIWGKGLVAGDIAANNILYEGQRTDLLANDRQEDLPSFYKMPWSVAGGVNFNTKRGQAGIAFQYFGREEMYDMLQARPAAFVRPPQADQSLGSDDFLRVRAANKPVVNWAVGYEHIISNRVTLDVSFRADNSYFDNNIHDVIGIKPAISSWDIYHTVLGGSISNSRVSLSAGLLIGFGNSKNYKQESNLEQPSERNLLEGSTIITEAHYHSVGLLLGFTINFNKKK